MDIQFNDRSRKAVAGDHVILEDGERYKVIHHGADGLAIEDHGSYVSDEDDSFLKAIGVDTILTDEEEDPGILGAVAAGAAEVLGGDDEDEDTSSSSSSEDDSPSFGFGGFGGGSFDGGGATGSF